MADMKYGDLTPRQTLFAYETFLDRAEPYLCIQNFADSKEIPSNQSKTVSFRRYETLSNAPSASTISEGVTPTALTGTFSDVSCTLVQYGSRIAVTDWTMDLHQDDVFNEYFDILGEQAAQVIEKAHWSRMIAGTNVQYSNSTSTSACSAVVSEAILAKALRTMKRNNARYITKALASSVNYGTKPIDKSYVALVHPDMEKDLRTMTGFVSRELYAGSMTPYDGELGSWRNIRFMASSLYEPKYSAGASDGCVLVTSGGSKCDIYPIVIFGAGFYGTVALKGKNAVTPMALKPKVSDSDPMAQRGHVAWKTYSTGAILNDLFGIRVEVGCSL